MWYVYILRCRDRSLYTGVTNDLPKRIQNHSSGKGARYTRSHTPVKLVYKERCTGRSQALKRENQIKRLSKNQKEALVTHGYLKRIEPQG